MKSIILLFAFLACILTGCGKEGEHGIIVGKDITTHTVDIKLDSGDVKFMYLSSENFYSGNYEIGDEWEVSCVLERCSPLKMVSE